MDPLLAIGLWVVVAFALSAIPSSDKHWRLAYGLIVVGLPLLIWIFWRHGVLFGLIGLVAGCLVLRWPLYYFWQWLKRKAGRGAG
ncbi:MAG: DUF2484 family protein [Yoonia sp.]|uniref:DUF2484 family protein n=1 Tax=Yoonia sp. TaxID=2212373 RepID=UPI003EF9F32F